MTILAAVFVAAALLLAYVAGWVAGATFDELETIDHGEWRRWMREALDDAEAARIREDLETWPGPR